MADKNFYPGDVPDVWYRDSDVPGPTVVVLGGIHGNEQAGIAVVERLVSGDFAVPLERGKLIAVLGNTAAIAANKRDLGDNLNRKFRKATEEDLAGQEAKPSYEFARAQELLPVLDEADAALDLHGFRPHDGIPFIITEPRGFQAARAIGAPYISSGWSTIEAGGTDGYMEEQGKLGVCYELSQLEDLKQGIPRGEAGVLSFLEHMQVIEMVRERAPEPPEPTFVHATKSVLARPGFNWGPGHPYRSFQALQPGELIAQNGTEPEDIIRAGDNQVIIFPSSDTQPKVDAEMFNLGTIIDPSEL